MHIPKRLVVCPACACHHSGDELACPHCGAGTGGRAAAALLLGLSLATGCEGKVVAMYGAVVTYPWVTITSPADGATVAAGDVEVDATVSDEVPDDLSSLGVAWALDDAAVCADAVLDASWDTLCILTLSAGDHTVSLTVTNPDDDSPGDASITLHVTSDTGP